MTGPLSAQRLQTLLPLVLFLLNLIDSGRGRAAQRAAQRADSPSAYEAAIAAAAAAAGEHDLSARTQTILRGPVPVVGGHAGQFQPGSEENEYVLDLNKLSMDPDSLMKHIKDLASALNTCGFDGQLQQLRLHHVTNRSVTCNDGSPAGYYLRKSYGSKKWLIFLEGGLYCYDTVSCQNRHNQSSRLMSSCGWPQTRIGSGIMSARPEENPLWWRANVVIIPYCSSDVWTGTSAGQETGGFSFMGALILDQVLQDLLPEGLMEAKQLVLAGSSAGGTGVLLNLDHVAHYLSEAGSSARVVGLADSGWFLEAEPLGSTQTDCLFDIYCNPARTLQRGTALWGSRVPESCLSAHADKWKCFYGFRVHQTLKTPVFIFQWLYDEVQLAVNMQGPPLEARSWHTMQKIGRQMRSSLRNATTVFAPACYAHMVLNRSDWSTVKVRNVKLSKSLQCWLKNHETPRGTPGEPTTSRTSKQQEGDVAVTSAGSGTSVQLETPSDEPDNSGAAEGTTRTATTDSTTSTTGRRRKPRKRRRKGGKRRRKLQTTDEPQEEVDVERDVPVSSTEPSWTSNDDGGRRGGRGRREGGRVDGASTGSSNNGRSSSSSSGNDGDGSRRGSGKKCINRLVDHATCPYCNPSCAHCNPTCPKITDPRMAILL